MSFAFVFQRKFILLQQEGFLAEATLRSGLDALRKAKISDPDKGRFYEAFFLLSVGFERILKLAVIYDFMRKNDLALPTDSTLRSYGHDIVRLYETCRNIETPPTQGKRIFVSHNTLEYQILIFLSDFSKSKRYYNLDILTGDAESTDPILKWQRILWEEIRCTIPAKKRERIQQKAVESCTRIFPGPTAMVAGFDGRPILAFEHFAFSDYVSVISPHLVWRVINLLSPIYSLLSILTECVHEVEVSKGIPDPAVPFLDEFFGFLLLDKATVLRRKQWRDSA